MAYDDPVSIQGEEARQLLGRPPGGGGYAAFDLVMIAVAIVGGAIAVEEVDYWSQRWSWGPSSSP
jgi:hypothetical protein